MFSLSSSLLLRLLLLQGEPRVQWTLLIVLLRVRMLAHHLFGLLNDVWVPLIRTFLAVEILMISNLTGLYIY